MQVLLQAGASVQTHDKDGWAPVHLAAEAGNLGALQLLLSAGADPNCCTAEGLTPVGGSSCTATHAQSASFHHNVLRCTLLPPLGS